MTTAKGSAAAKSLCSCGVVDEDLNVMIINRSMVSFHYVQESLLVI